MSRRNPTWQTALAALLLVLPLATSRGNDAVELNEQVRQQLAALVAGNGDERRALSGLMVGVIRDGQVAFEAAFGHARIADRPENSQPMTPDSLVRVASVSKTVCTVAVMQLVDEGLLDLDRDVSDYLGWTLRNPHYPDRPITLAQLLSHTSSLRDAGESYIIRYPHTLREAFDSANAAYAERFQAADGGADRGPGIFYEYSNLNFGVVGTVLEKVTGERFDRLMHRRFYAPLGLTGGFNVAELPALQQDQLATLYRKRDANEVWNPAGAWVPQVDDLSGGIPTALPEGAVYVPGTNGAQFSPQGGARLSLHGMEALATLFMGDGSVNGVRLLSAQRAAQLHQTVWRYDPARNNLENYDGTLHERAIGLRIITGETAGDRLFTGDQRRWYGHFGEAYGLLSGVWAQPESQQAVVYAITGTAFDPHAEADGSSTLTPIEAAVLEQLGRLVRGD